MADEIGPGSGPDPHCRTAFPWQAPQAWDRELLAFYRQAIALRHRYPALRTGTFHTLSAGGEVYAFGRTLPTQAAVVVCHVGTAPVTLDLPLGEWGHAGQIFEAVWGRGRYVVRQQTLPGVTIAARQAVIAISDRGGTGSLPNGWTGARESITTGPMAPSSAAHGPVPGAPAAPARP